MADTERSFKKPRPTGAGLSLDKFARAGYSKYDKRKKIEKLRKDKIIKYGKYQKIKKRLEGEGRLGNTFIVKDSIAELEELEKAPKPNNLATDPTPSEGKDDVKKRKRFESESLGHEDQTGSSDAMKEPHQDKGKDRRKVRPLSRLQRVAMEAQAKKEEESRAKEEARAAREEKQRRIAEVEKVRKAQKSQFFRKTTRGQPVMSVRVDKILGQLQREQQQGGRK